jgi:hypothetical protein
MGARIVEASHAMAAHIKAQVYRVKLNGPQPPNGPQVRMDHGAQGKLITLHAPCGASSLVMMAQSVNAIRAMWSQLCPAENPLCHGAVHRACRESRPYRGFALGSSTIESGDAATALQHALEASRYVFVSAKCPWAYGDGAGTHLEPMRGALNANGRLVQVRLSENCPPQRTPRPPATTSGAVTRDDVGKVAKKQRSDDASTVISVMLPDDSIVTAHSSRPGRGSQTTCKHPKASSALRAQ